MTVPLEVLQDYVDYGLLLNTGYQLSFLRECESQAPFDYTSGLSTA